MIPFSEEHSRTKNTTEYSRSNLKKGLTSK